jgi:hypothetical protein
LIAKRNNHRLEFVDNRPHPSAPINGCEVEMRRPNLRNDRWEGIERMLPGKASDPGRPAADNRGFGEAVPQLARTGAPLRDLSEGFAKWNRV